MKNDNLKHKQQCAIHDVSTCDFEELYEAVKVQLEIIKNLIASKRVVNLDEAIAYYETLLKKHEHHVC